MERLRRVVPGEAAGFRRVRAGRGFRFLRDDGTDATPREKRRIRALAVPPAWTDVWIAVDPRAHIQAVGTDDAGRRQYLYHPRWRERRDRRKFVRALALAEALPAARARITRALHGGDEGERVRAAAVRLLDDAALRIGSERYRVRYGSRGLTTLRRRDVRVDGADISLSFPAKSGKRASVEITDPDLAEVLRDLANGPARTPLLARRRGRRRVRLTEAEVNAYIRTVTGGRFTAKDFRTLRATILAARSLAETGPAGSEPARRRAERVAVQVTADALGNTPAVARSSYIDPRVFRRYAQGRLLDLSVSPETAIRELLS